MSLLQRLLRTTRTANPFQTLQKPTPSRPSTSNYFTPSRPTRFNYFTPSRPTLSPRSPLPSSKALTPPRTRAYSSFPSDSQSSTNLRVLYALMGANIAIFSYAMYARAQAQAGYPARYLSFMRNMSCNLTDVLKNNYFYTVFTSTFTHVEVWHLAGNMFTAYYLGSFLCYAPVITPGRFLTIALGAGVAGSVGYLYQRYLANGGVGRDMARGLGFSGALMGITSVAACLAPTAKVYIYGVIPLPLWATVAGYAVYDGYYLNDNKSRVGHAGHLGGLAFGIAYYLLRLRGLRV